MLVLVLLVTVSAGADTIQQSHPTMDSMGVPMFQVCCTVPSCMSHCLSVPSYELLSSCSSKNTTDKGNRAAWHVTQLLGACFLQQ